MRLFVFQYYSSLYREEKEERVSGKTARISLFFFSSATLCHPSDKSLTGAGFRPIRIKTLTIIETGFQIASVFILAQLNASAYFQ